MTSSSQPLRLAIIGLSGNAATSWASTAHLPGLLSPRGKQLFTIHGLLNSSVENGLKAIETYNLPSSVKAYASPQDLADDKDIDVVVCVVRVDNHYKTALPSVKAGKKTFIEWPIAANQQEVQELVEAARQSGAKVAVGVQGRQSPFIVKLREIIESGKIGKVLSSDITTYGGIKSRTDIPSNLSYFLDQRVGGNVVTIAVGHLLDFTLAALGDLKKGSVSARTQIQYDTNNLVDPQTKKIVGSVATDVPDLVYFHGGLTSEKGHLAPDASYSIRFRRGKPFKDDPSLVWHINGDKGEIRVRAVDSMALHAFYGSPPEINVHNFEDDIVEVIPWSWSEEQEKLPLPARGIASVLYALAEDDEQKYVSLENAAHRAEQIDGLLTSGKW